MNSVNITGRIVADPELRQTQSGIPTVRFTVAVDRPYQKDKEKESDFISCVAWRASAEFISRNFHKGDPIEVSGSLRTGKYQDRNHSDVTHYTTDILVDKVAFTQSKRERNTNTNGSEQAYTGQSTSTTSDYVDMSEFEEILSDGDCPF